MSEPKETEIFAQPTEVTETDEVKENAPTISGEIIQEDTIEKGLKEAENDEEHTELNTVDSEGYEDILGSGRLRRKVIKPGNEKGGRVDRGCVAKVHVKIWFHETPDKVYEEDSELCVGEYEKVQAIDMILPLMKEKEISEVISDPDFAYGNNGLPGYIPSNGAATFQIELLSFSEPYELEKLSLEEKMAIGLRKKNCGNEWFCRGDHFALASQCYGKAVNFFQDDNLELDVPVDKFQLPENLRKMLEERIKTYNNMAMCQIKTENFDGALNSLKHVLKVEPNNEKALYRKSTVFRATYETDKAMGLLRRITRLYPENKEAKRDLQQLLAKNAQDRKREVERSKAMLGLNKPDKNKNNKKGWTSLLPNSTVALSGLAAAVLGIVALSYKKLF